MFLKVFAYTYLPWFSDKFLKVTIEGDVDAARSQDLDVPEPGEDKV